MNNICAQLIAYHKLDYAVLPPSANQDAGFLVKLLNEISDLTAGAEKTIILIDALDEADHQDTALGNNVLHLPKILPNGVFIVATCRQTEIPLSVECEHEYYEIRQDSKQNIGDIQKYVEKSIQKATFNNYLDTHDVEVATFIEQMVTKSQGNFMYLRYVLPEIEAGAYTTLSLDHIPAGLMNYYEDHWRRMRGQNKEAWIAYKLPIIVALTIVTHPVSLDSIVDFSEVQDRRRIRVVLIEWKEFLFETSTLTEKDIKKRWRMYHDTFRDFIVSKDEVAGEFVDLKKAHGRISDQLWQDLMGNEQLN